MRAVDKCKWTTMETIGNQERLDENGDPVRFDFVAIRMYVTNIVFGATRTSMDIPARHMRVFFLCNRYNMSGQSVWDLEGEPL